MRMNLTATHLQTLASERYTDVVSVIQILQSVSITYVENEQYNVRVLDMFEYDIKLVIERGC